jgi:pimeloyl-ACP methyl ester carboxylesterase
LREIDMDKPFWRAYFRGLIPAITKEECVGRLRIWVEFDLHSRFTPHDLDAWPGRILILEAQADAIYPPHERAALRSLYPRAQVVSFPGLSHAASLARQDGYIEAISGFLSNSPAVKPDLCADAVA